MKAYFDINDFEIVSMILEGECLIKKVLRLVRRIQYHGKDKGMGRLAEVLSVQRLVTKIIEGVKGVKNIEFEYNRQTSKSLTREWPRIF